MISLLYPANDLSFPDSNANISEAFRPVTLFQQNEKVQFSAESLSFSPLRSEVFVHLKEAEMTAFYCGSVDGFSHACLSLSFSVDGMLTADTAKPVRTAT